MRRSLFSLLMCICIPFAASGQVCDLTGWRIFVDPGHGGTDPGAIGPSGLQEKDVTLDASLHFKQQLECLGATVMISRDTDIFVPLATRADMANEFGADRFISVHMNSFTSPTANGTEVYVIPNPNEITRDLGQQTLYYLLGYLGLRDRGLKFANFAVLVRTNMPAALSESAFISNPEEEALLADPFIRWIIGQAHAWSICQHTFTSSELFQSNQSVLPQIQSEQETQGRIHLIASIKGADRLINPKFSPDGQYLAFSSVGFRGLYVADINRLGDVRQISSQTVLPHFSWSTDGQTIAFVSREAGGYSVNLANLQNGRTEEVGKSSAPVRPLFSSNGELLLLNAYEGNIKRLGGDDSRSKKASWSVAYIKDRQIWMETDGGSKQVTNDQLIYNAPQLNSARTRIIAGGSSADGHKLFAFDLKSRERRVINPDVRNSFGNQNISYAAIWSPSGDNILLSVLRDNGHDYIGSDWYLTDLQGANPIQLAFDGAVRLNPDWSSQGKIAYEDAEGRIIIASVLD